MKVKNLVVGCGFSGAVIAERLANVLGESVLIIDRREHLAGNCYDFQDSNGITIHRYGPHIFHTNDDKVWEYISQFATWQPYSHEVLALVDGETIPVPFNFNSLEQKFPKKAAELEEKLIQKYGKEKKIPILELEKDVEFKELADFIYEKIFLNYTKKQWGLKPEELDKSVFSRVPVMLGYDNRYFQDNHQAIPESYTLIIENMLSNPLIEVKLGVEFSQIKDNTEYERLFFTGAIDEFFEYEFGALPYRSLDLRFEELDCEYFQAKAVVNYPNDKDFTRITEFKHFLDEKSSKTVILKEFPEVFEVGKNERFYAILNEKNLELYKKYLAKAKDVIFLGRLGDYQYYDMDKAISRALKVFEDLEQSCK
jgi:UDP-galactopyranose mutase